MAALWGMVPPRVHWRGIYLLLSPRSRTEQTWDSQWMGLGGAPPQSAWMESYLQRFLPSPVHTCTHSVSWDILGWRLVFINISLRAEGRHRRTRLPGPHMDFSALALELLTQ